MLGNVHGIGDLVVQHHRLVVDKMHAPVAASAAVLVDSGRVATNTPGLFDGCAVPPANPGVGSIDLRSERMDGGSDVGRRDVIVRPRARQLMSLAVACEQGRKRR